MSCSTATHRTTVHLAGVSKLHEPCFILVHQGCQVTFGPLCEATLLKLFRLASSSHGTCSSRTSHLCPDREVEPTSSQAPFVRSPEFSSLLLRPAPRPRAPDVLWAAPRLVRTEATVERVRSQKRDSERGRKQWEVFVRGEMRCQASTPGTGHAQIALWLLLVK